MHPYSVHSLYQRTRKCIEHYAYLHHKNSSNCFIELFWPFDPKLVGTPDGVGEVPDWMKNGTKIHF